MSQLQDNITNLQTLLQMVQELPEGVELNFEVVGGTSQPSNPKENTIWVNTDITITSWVFSPTEPTIPIPGMVWINVGESSDIAFNALKINTIQIYPISAKQYIGITWTNVTANIYQEDTWTQLNNGLIYDSGRFYDSFDAEHTTLYGSDGTIIKNSDNLRFRGSGEDVHLFYFTPAISLAGYNTLNVTIKSKSGTMYESAGKIGLVTSPGVGVAENERFAAYTSFNSAKTYSVDVSGITENTKYYIALRFEVDQTTYTVDISKVWLE